MSRTVRNTYDLPDRRANLRRAKRLRRAAARAELAALVATRRRAKDALSDPGDAR